MIVRGLTEIGKNRPPCIQTVRVAAGLVTHEAKRRVWRTAQANIPVDQCGKRADFIVDNRPLCRAHAGALALAHIIETQEGVHNAKRK